MNSGQSGQIQCKVNSIVIADSSISRGETQECHSVTLYTKQMIIMFYFEFRSGDEKVFGNVCIMMRLGTRVRAYTEMTRPELLNLYYENRKCANVNRIMMKENTWTKF